jgi:hypothetical protein
MLPFFLTYRKLQWKTYTECMALSTAALMLSDPWPNALKPGQLFFDVCKIKAEIQLFSGDITREVIRVS